MLPDIFDRFRLADRTALVTGARREIGRAIALALAAAGARLAIHHADTGQEAADADRVVREIEEGGGVARAFGQDFALEDAGVAWPRPSARGRLSGRYSASRPAGLADPTISSERRCCCARTRAPTSTASISTSMAAGRLRSRVGYASSGPRLAHSSS